MNLDEAQKRKVAEWIAQGLKLSEIQTRLADELGVRLTYIDVRLLVDDLKLMPKDLEPPKTVELASKQASANVPGEESEPTVGADETLGAGPGGVSVKVDQVTRPGALVSGSVTFSDGNTAVWYLDQLGRLGLAPKQQGYKPPAADLQTFQMELQNALAKMGF